MTTTDIAVVKKELMRPIARPAQVLAALDETRLLVKEALRVDVDYGVIPGAGPRKVLLKPGAEKLCAAFGVVARYDVVEREIDHDREVRIHTKRGPLDVLGLYRYVVRCTLSTADGVDRGGGMASCSTLESKWASRPRDVENTVLKMACKRALVAATLSTFGLSEAFTQDVDDDEGATVDATPQPSKDAERPQVDDMPEVRLLARGIAHASDGEELARLNDRRGDVTSSPKKAFALGALVAQRAAQLADEEWTGSEQEQRAVEWLRKEIE